MLAACGGSRGELFRTNFFDLRDKPVSPAWKRFDVSGRTCRVAQNVAHTRHRVVQAVVKIHEGIRRPDLHAKLFPCHQVASPLQQSRQHLQRLPLKPELYTALTQFASAGIEFKDVEAQHAGGRRSQRGAFRRLGPSLSQFPRAGGLACEVKQLFCSTP